MVIKLLISISRNVETRREQSRLHAQKKRAEKATKKGPTQSRLQHAGQRSFTEDHVDMAVQTDDIPISNVSGTYTVFRNLLELLNECESWFDRVNVDYSSFSIDTLLDHVVRAGRLAVRLHRVLDENVPENEHDLSRIHESVSTMQLALGSRCSAMFFYYSHLRYQLPELPWDYPSLLDPLGTDDDTTWVYKNQVLPLRQRSAAIIEQWGTGKPENQSCSEVRVLTRARREVNAVYSEWHGFYNFPQEYFSYGPDKATFFKEMCCTVFALGVAIARIDYGLSNPE
jgi:hypothetical protein